MHRRPNIFAAKRPARGLRRRAFTLVEATLSVVLVSGVLVATMGTFGAISRSRQVQVDRAAAAFLAQQVMAEIMQCYYQEPAGAGSLGPDAGEGTRTAYDDVDDYENWQMSPPVRRDGTALDSYTGWRVKVRVTYADPANPDAAANVDTGLKRIRVTVTSPAGMESTVAGLRAAGGAYEQLPYETTTYVTGVSASARVGANGRTIAGGAHPLNVTSTSP